MIASNGAGSYSMCIIHGKLADKANFSAYLNHPAQPPFCDTVNALLIAIVNRLFIVTNFGL